MSRKRLAGFLGFFVWVVVASPVATGSSTVSAPADVRALSASESRIDLSWQDRSTNETGFEIHRSTSGATGSYTLLSGTAAQAVSWTDSGLNPSAGYCYKVRAVRTVGAKTTFSAFSPAACATTLAPAVPVPPSSVQATAVSDVAVTVSWQDASTNESGFEVFRSSSGPDGPFTSVGRTNPDATAIFDGGLSASTQYCYRVRAFRLVDAPLYSAFSDAACATTHAPPVGSTLRIEASTTGADLDADGYVADVWKAFSGGGAWLGIGRFTVPASGAITVTGLSPAEYRVALSGIAANCDPPPGVNPARVIVGASSDPAVVRFDMTCTEAPEIAFADAPDGNWDIFVIDSNGDNRRRLTTDPAADKEPAWSPDGARIAFRSDRDGADEIYVMNGDGSAVVRLTHSGGNFRPAWSPDGTKIAFTSQRDGNNDVYVMAADGSGQVNITNHPADDRHPTWAPDGSHIAFSSTRDNPFGYPGIFVTDSTGATAIGLSTDPYTPQSEPAWSPDGRWLAVWAWGAAQTIWLIDPVDGATGPWTTAGELDCEAHSAPVWSRDSSKIAFTVTNYCSGNSAVHLVRRDQVELLTNGTRLTTGSDPSWRQR